MSQDFVYLDPWRQKEILPELTAYIDEQTRLLQIPEPEDRRTSTELIAKGMLVATTLLAPLVIRPQKAHAIDTIRDTPQVVVIGDSLTVGRKKADMHTALESSGFLPTVLSAYGGRPLVLPGCDTTPVKQACYEFSDGVREVLKAHKQIDDADIVMLNLGTNDQAGELQKRLERTLDTIAMVGSEQDGTPPIIVVPEIFGNNPKISSDVKNTVIHAVASEYNAKGLQVVVPNYKEFVDTKIRPAGKISNDEVHLTGAGYKDLVQHDIEVLKSIVAAQKPDTKPQPEMPQKPTSPTPKPTSPQQSRPLNRASLADMFSTLPTIVPDMPKISNTQSEPTQLTAPRFDLNMIPLDTVAHIKKQTAQSLAIQYVEPPQLTELSETTKPLNVARPLLSPQPQSTAETPATSQNVSIQKAAAAGIFYDQSTGRAMTTFKSFIDAKKYGTPEMRHGFKEPRDLPDTDPYVHANSDWHAPLGTEFIAPVSAVVLRYDDKYPGQKKSVGNSLVFVMGNDTNGNPITIQATHFSEILVQNGDIVTQGQVVAKSGETGIAYGAHDSVGMSSDGSLQPYTNLSHSLNLTDYIDFDYTCAPSATDDPGEICANDAPALPLPVNPLVLKSLGIPEYIQNSNISAAEPLPSAPIAGDIFGQQQIIEPPQLDKVSEITTQDPVVLEPKDINKQDEPADVDSVTDYVDPAVELPQEPAELSPVTDGVSPNDITEPTVPADPATAETDSDTEPQNPADTTENQPQKPDDEAPRTEPTVPDQPSTPQENPEQSAESDPNDATMGETPKTIYDFFMSQGMTHQGVIGLMANLRAESGLNPTRTQNSWRGACAVAPERLDPSTKEGDGTKGQGFGLAQWTLASRQLALQAYADQTGRPWTDIHVQLEYTMIELQSGYFDHVLEVLKTTTSIEEATIIVLTDFENPAVHNKQERLALAQELAQNIEAGNFAAIDVECN